MSDQIAVALISAIVGGLLVATVNHLFTRKKTEAETDKLRAEAEKLREETRQLTIHTKPTDADHAMAEAIKDSRETIQILGITLRGFFSGGGSESAQELRKVCLLETGPSIRVVLLDDDMSAEAALSHDGRISEAHEKLSRDIRETIRIIQRDFPNVEIRLVKSVTSFMLTTDCVVFIEPHMYRAPSFVESRLLFEIRQGQLEATYKAHFESAWYEGRPY